MNEGKLPASVVFDEEDIPRITDLKQKAKTLFFTGVPSMIAAHGILAGGCFASWMHGDDPKDYDIFFLDTPDVANMYNDWFIPHLVTDGSYGVSKSIIYSTKTKMQIKEVWNHPNRRCQYIFTSYTKREELIEDFDLVHTKMSYCRPNKSEEGTIYTSKQTLDAIRLQHLIPTGKQTISKNRIDKFLERGWMKIEKPAPVVVDVETSDLTQTSGTITIPGGPYANTIFGGCGGGTISAYPQPLTPTEDFKEEIKKLIGIYNVQLDESSIVKIEENKTKKILEEEKKKLLGAPQKSPNPDWFDALKTKLSKPWDN
jgi:hypothetical protein